ncbi:hypothetical protein BH23ACT2_BH23ACT2_12340 [soil metagenome]
MTACLDQLFVDPDGVGRGVGSALLEQAKERRPDGLDLWTFEGNTGARRFYERHGFRAVARADGLNEEGAPDVRYRWPMPAESAVRSRWSSPSTPDPLGAGSGPPDGGP